MHAIYTITSPSGKRYVGSAVRLRFRWYSHKTALAAGTHHCAGLQSASNKYGLAALVFEVVEECRDKQSLISREQHWIDSFPRSSLYNSYLTAGSPLGYKHTPETKAKMSARKRGVPRKFSAEGRANILAAVTGNTFWLGKKHKEETKAKIGAKHKGKVVSEESRDKIAASRVKYNTSGQVGVSFSKTARRWCARYKQTHIGWFATFEEAVAARAAYLESVTLPKSTPSPPE